MVNDVGSPDIVVDADADGGEIIGCASGCSFEPLDDDDDDDDDVVEDCVLEDESVPMASSVMSSSVSLLSTSLSWIEAFFAIDEPVSRRGLPL